MHQCEYCCWYNECSGYFWMDNINGRTNDKPMGLFFGGYGSIPIKISTPRQLGCMYRQHHHCGYLFVCHY